MFPAPDPEATSIRPVLDFKSQPPALRWVVCIAGDQTGIEGPFETIAFAVGQHLTAA